MSDAIFISSIISVITLIVFFVMSSNIATIKTYVKAFERKTDWYNEYLKRTHMNRPDEDKLFAAQEYVWEQLCAKRTEKNYNELKSIWSAKFVQLGGEFPDYPFKG